MHALLAEKARRILNLAIQKCQTFPGAHFYQESGNPVSALSEGQLNSRGQTIESTAIKVSKLFQARQDKSCVLFFSFLHISCTLINQIAKSINVDMR